MRNHVINNMQKHLLCNIILKLSQPETNLQVRHPDGHIRAQAMHKCIYLSIFIYRERTTLRDLLFRSVVESLLSGREGSRVQRSRKSRSR